MKKTILIFFFVFVRLSSAQNLPMDLSTVITQSSSIVYIKVLNTECRWINDQFGNHIYTIASLQVLNNIKGNLPGVFEYRYIGGKVGNIREVASTAFSLKKDEEAILFLNDPFREGCLRKIPVQEGKIFFDLNPTNVQNFITSIKQNIDFYGKDIINGKILQKESKENREINSTPSKNDDHEKKEKNMLSQKNIAAGIDLSFWLKSTWQDMIVIKQHRFSTTPTDDSLSHDEAPFVDSKETFLSFYTLNKGDIESPKYDVKIYVDNVVYSTSTASYNLPAGYVQIWYNKSVGWLSSGMHTIKLVVDPDNKISESDETNNEITRTITVNHTPGALPDLAFLKLDNWADKIVLKNAYLFGINPTWDYSLKNEDVFYDGDILYLNFAYQNSGNLPTKLFHFKIYVDNIDFSGSAIYRTGVESALYPGNYWYFSNIYIGSFSSGQHTIKMVLNSDNLFEESNKANNEYSRIINVTHKPGTPTITSITPQSVSAGTNSFITITGSGFGNLKGNNLIELFYRNEGRTARPVVIKQWSENQIICEVPIDSIDNYDASASSGPVFITNSFGRSNGYNIDVLFSHQYRWTTNSVQYYLNESPEVFHGEINNVKAAISAWNSSNSNLNLQQAGTTTAIITSSNGKNEISCAPLAANLGGQAYYWVNDSTGLKTESDVILNSNLNWDLSTSNTKFAFSIQSTMLHELGHFVGLRDLYAEIGDSAKIMLGWSTLNTNLSSGEIMGIKWLYGEKNSSSFFILGNIVLNSSIPLSYVSMNISGERIDTVLTDMMGRFNFRNLPTSNYTLTPVKSGYYFIPRSKTFSNLNDNQLITFNAKQGVQTFKISGTILTGTSGLPGVSIHLMGNLKDTTFVTNNSGIYQFTNLPAGEVYTITPGKNNYVFSPSSYTFGLLDGDSLRNFTALTFPTAPVLTYPSNGAKNIEITPIFSWNPIDDAILYKLQVSIDGSFNSYITNDSTITKNSKQVAIHNNTLYFWRVAAKNSVGWSAYSNVNQFTTIIPSPAVPFLGYPADRSTNIATNPILTWTQNSSTEKYHLQITSDSLFNNIIFADSNIISSSIQINNLRNDTKYYWRVRGINDWLISTWSDIFSFRTIPEISTTPNPVWPVSGMKNVVVPVTLKWTKVKNAINYGLIVSSDSSFIMNIVLNDSTLVDTIKLITPLINKTKYYWKVLSKNIAGSSSFSEIWNFSTQNSCPQKFSLIPTGDINLIYPSKPVTFSWKRSVDADKIDTIRYKLVVIGIDSSFSASDTTIALPILDKLTRGKTYQWYVKASDGDTTVYSDTLSFKTSQEIVHIDANGKEIPQEFVLYQNYPNPFNPATYISFDLPKALILSLEVYNVLGDKIRTLIDNQIIEAGQKTILWEGKDNTGRNVPSGLYFYRFASQEFNSIKKMILMK